MTRLMKFLVALSAFFSCWLALLSVENIPDEWRQVILAFPVYVLICFGCYSLAVIGYRLYIFNDCLEAAEELKKEIVEARDDLQRKGFKFDS